MSKTAGGAGRPISTDCTSAMKDSAPKRRHPPQIMVKQVTMESVEVDAARAAIAEEESKGGCMPSFEAGGESRVATT